MKRPIRFSTLFLIGLFAAGSTALGYYYYFVYGPPLAAAERFMRAMETGDRKAVAASIIVRPEVDDGKLRPPTEAELQMLVDEGFERGRILDQKKSEGNTRDYYYLFYRERDGRVYALLPVR